MKKFVNFCKKPLLFATGGIFLVFMIMLITVCCVPHGRTYVYSLDFGPLSMDIYYTFKKGNVLEEKFYVNGELYSDASGEESKYKIIDKNLFVEDLNGGYTNIGKIDSFKIKLNMDEMFGDIFGGGTETDPSYNDYSSAIALAMLSKDMTCEANIKLRTTSIVFMSVSGVLFLCCLTLFVLDKNGIIKYKQKAVAGEAESTDTPTEQTASTEPVSEIQTSQTASAESSQTGSAAQNTEAVSKPVDESK